jgi:hypothetical protein
MNKKIIQIIIMLVKNLEIKSMIMNLEIRLILFMKVLCKIKFILIHKIIIKFMVKI